MAICQDCGQDMKSATTCTIEGYVFPDREMKRIPFGSEKPKRRMPRCGDCGVTPGGYHHPGCDLEQCPRCLYQSISCGCSESRPESGHDEDNGPPWTDVPYAIETLSKVLREGPEPMPYDHIFIEPVGPCGHVGRGHVRDMERGAEPPLEEWFTLGKRLGSSRAILFVCHTQDLEHVSEVDLEVGRKMAAYADTNHEPPWELVYVTHQGNFKASELLALPGLPVFDPCRYRFAPLPTERLSRWA